MTTFAYRAGVLAADTLVTLSGNSRLGSTVKIAKRGPFLAAGSGLHPFVQGFLDWFVSGMDQHRMPLMQGADKDNWAVGRIFMPDGRVIRCTAEGWVPVVPIDGLYAGGSGADYALGAMAMGASAEEAVRVAMRYDTGTGGEVMTLRHDGT